MGLGWGEEAGFGIFDIGVCDIMRLKPFSLSERWRVHHAEIISLASLYISVGIPLSIMDKIAVLESTALIIILCKHPPIPSYLF